MDDDTSLLIGLIILIAPEFVFPICAVSTSWSWCTIPSLQIPHDSGMVKLNSLSHLIDPIYWDYCFLFDSGNTFLLLDEYFFDHRNFCYFIQNPLYRTLKLFCVTLGRLSISSQPILVSLFVHYRFDSNQIFQRIWVSFD